MNNYFVILAAGKGSRFSNKKPKQYHLYKNKELYEHSINKSISSKLFKKIILVVDNPKKIKKKFSEKIIIIKGGKERSESSLISLKFLKKFKPNNILIHDAARPNFSISLIKKIIKELEEHSSVIPVVNPNDSIKYKLKNHLYNLNRNKTFLTQTPQGFKFKKLYNLALKEKNKINDEATLFINKDKKVKLIKGEFDNNKITYIEDIKIPKTYFGIGFDIHKLIKKKKLYLGGIKVPFHSGLKGHSDGDVILHAIIDALLGAMKKKDIGTFFPSNKKKFKNIRSPKMLKPILTNLNKENFSINNLDINLICERPKVSKYRNRIIDSISKLMDLRKDKINLKGKTVEKIGLIGKENAIACETIVSISKYE
ncbi:MAG: 2-C-methyl-D-erythritol 2,4-cyclodiphosphate synthase [Candidatus Pelagibacter sp. TMED239]|nr:MAG: 2-C-methyl-D-erythritol 2,4-cyclodiphosphate synthase [Candidatus Pelagibacter sp. TMED239]|tara:strand:- start:800 stop:1906 length:1107 start_codon:yes stop_codon:yes gene_type:complete